MFTLFVFLMADIKTMHRTLSQADVWIPSEMTRATEARPKITSFASEHDPAKLYANLLLSYTSSRSNLTGTLHAEGIKEGIKYRWYQESGTSGYFCEHDNYVHFVRENEDIITCNFSKLKQIIASFKAKYEATDWTLPTATAVAAVVPQKEPNEKRLEQLLAEKEGKQSEWTRKRTLQEVADTLEKEKTLTVAALLRADWKLHHSVRPCALDHLLGGQAAPHIHPYNSVFYSKAFSLEENIFVTFDKSFGEDKEEFMLFRPHNWYLYCEKIDRQKYEETYKKNVPLPKITSEISFPDEEQPMRFTTSSFSVHEGASAFSTGKVTILSWNEPIIGSFRALLKKKLLFSEITDPPQYKAKTLHIILDDPGPPVPDNPEQLIEYFEKLPLPPEQQKRLIQGLFPFLRV